MTAHPALTHPQGVPVTTVHHDTPLPDRVRLAEAQAQVEHLQGRLSAALAMAARWDGRGADTDDLLDDLYVALDVVTGDQSGHPKGTDPRGDAT